MTTVPCTFCGGQGEGEVRDAVGDGPLGSVAYETRCEPCAYCDGTGELVLICEERGCACTDPDELTVHPELGRGYYICQDHLHSKYHCGEEGPCPF